MQPPKYEIGRILAGDKSAVEAAAKELALQPIDDVRLVDGNDTGFLSSRTTIQNEAVVTGPGTFAGKFQRTLRFKPSRI